MSSVFSLVLSFHYIFTNKLQAFGIHGHEEETADEHAHGDAFMEEFIGYGLAALGGNNIMETLQ